MIRHGSGLIDLILGVSLVCFVYLSAICDWALAFFGIVGIMAWVIGCNF